MRHSYAECLERTESARKYSRTTAFKKHLESHKATKGTELAMKWGRKTRAIFTCRYCCYLSSAITEHTNHTDVDHFRRLQEINDWDPSKVIRTLLLKGFVSAAWHQILASKTPPYSTAAFTWKRDIVVGAGGLQFRLELGIEDATTLADAAFQLSSYDSSMDFQPLEDLANNDMSFCDMLSQQQDSIATIDTSTPAMEQVMDSWLPADASIFDPTPPSFGPFHALISHPANQTDHNYHSLDPSFAVGSTSAYNFSPQSAHIASWSPLLTSGQAQLPTQSAQARLSDDASLMTTDDWQATSSLYDSSLADDVHTSMSASHTELPPVEDQQWGSSADDTWEPVSRQIPPMYQASVTPQSQCHRKSSSGFKKLIRRASFNMLKSVGQAKPDFDMDNVQRIMFDDEQARGDAKNTATPC